MCNFVNFTKFKTIRNDIFKTIRNEEIIDKYRIVYLFF